MIFNYFIIIILYSQIFSVRKFVDNTMKNGYNIIMSFYDVVYEQVKKYQRARSRRTGKSRFYAAVRAQVAPSDTRCISIPIPIRYRAIAS